MATDNEKNSMQENYREIAKKSLIRIQYSCGGNGTGIDEPEYIPIVPDDYESEESSNN